MTLKFFNKSEFLQCLIHNRWPWHVGFWTFYFIVELPIYFLDKHQPAQFWRLALYQDIGLIILTYFIILVFFPLFYFKKKYTLFFLVTICSTLIINLFVGYFIKDDINEFLKKVSSLPELTLLDSFLNGFSIAILFSAFITMAKISKAFFIAQYFENQQRKLQLQSELNNLKAQLSPHFLFNTMNNFYGLAVLKSDKLPNLMLRLSDLMRYSLYETKNDTVNLLDEIHFLENYIELEKIRLEDNLVLEFSYDSDKVKDFDIAPLLLIVFVENAFKHSRTSSNDPTKIKIVISISKDHFLEFEISNNYSIKTKLFEKDYDGGIGIDNVQTRLAVLYPNGYHSLEIQDLKTTFTVNLRLKLFKLF